MFVHKNCVFWQLLQKGKGLQTINYDAIVKNALYFKRKLGKAKLCAVLKNDAYGHGLVRTASVLATIADVFAVGTVAEALKVEPFCKDVLILLPQCADDCEIAAEHGFVQTADSFETLDRILKSVPRGKKARLHMKIQSGMNRFGFNLSQLPQLAEQSESSKLLVEGVFSHFYGTTETECDEQLKVFLDAANFLEMSLKKPLVKHMANTAAVQLLPKYFFDMARVGLGLFGYGAPQLLSAKTVTARVLAVRNIKKGEKISYGGTVVQHDAKIAVVGCGYANGFSRGLKNPKIMVNGVVCPVVGKVCMAVCMADVTDVAVSVGDEVTVFGNGLNASDENIIVYELLCNLK